ncbi:MAG: amidohydrolase family protein [Luteitalea sp.]|nr:amidohydrolase family protein [Luteitalea sp.]
MHQYTRRDLPSPRPPTLQRRRNTRRHARLTLTLLAVGIAAVALMAQPSPTTALVGVHVIAMDREDVATNQTILVRDGRIAEMGPAADVAVSAKTTRVDAEGKYVLPGLAEMHGHLAGDDAAMNERILLLNVAYGVTTLRNMQGHPAHLPLRDRVARGELLGPRIYTSGPALGAKSIPTPDEAVKVVTEQKEAGFDFLKTQEGVSRAAFDAMVETAQKLDIPFAGHVAADVGLERALEAHYKSVDHLDGYVEALLKPDAAVDLAKAGFFGSAVIEHVDESKIPEVAQATKEAGTAVVPTETLIENFFTSEPIDTLLAQPEMRYVPKDVLSDWESSKRKFMTDGEGKIPAEQRDRLHAVRRQIIKALHDAGVLLVLGADTPQVLNVPGVAIHRELSLMVKAGLTPYQALEMGTRNVAVYFDTLREAGTIEPGKRADLLVVDANPLDDIANTSKRFGVMVNGTWLSRAEIDEKLEALER